MLAWHPPWLSLLDYLTGLSGYGTPTEFPRFPVSSLPGLDSRPRLLWHSPTTPERKQGKAVHAENHCELNPRHCNPEPPTVSTWIKMDQRWLDHDSVTTNSITSLAVQFLELSKICCRRFSHIRHLCKLILLVGYSTNLPSIQCHGTKFQILWWGKNEPAGWTGSSIHPLYFLGSLWKKRMKENESVWLCTGPPVVLAFGCPKFNFFTQDIFPYYDTRANMLPVLLLTESKSRREHAFGVKVEFKRYTAVDRLSFPSHLDPRLGYVSKIRGFSFIIL